MEKITIVVPTYNCGDYIYDCLNSIKQQTYKNWECIIWNDGSTDNTFEIVKIFLEIDRRFKYGYSAVNEGLSVTLNHAYSYASGKYLCQVDADDILLPLALETCIKFFKVNTHVDLVYTNKLTFKDETNEYAEHWGNREFYSPMKLFYANPLVTHFRLMKLEAFINIGGYREDIEFGEDDDFAIRLVWGIHSSGKLVRQHKIKKINDICYLYRIRDGSMTQLNKNNVSINKNREHLKRKVMWSIFKFWRLNTLFLQIRWWIYKKECGE